MLISCHHRVSQDCKTNIHMVESRLLQMIYKLNHDLNVEVCLASLGYLSILPHNHMGHNETLLFVLGRISTLDMKKSL